MYASFNFETTALEYDIVMEGMQVKLLNDLSPSVLVEFSNFIKAHEDWSAGITDRPTYQNPTVA